MAVLSRFRRSHARVLGHLGGLTVQLRRRHTLRHSVTRAPYSALSLVGDHAAGAAALRLDAVNLVGRLPAGCRLTIAAAVYETTAAVDAVGGELVSVPIDPVLAAPASDNAVVTISRAYGEYEFTGAFLGPSSDALEERDDTTEVRVTRRRYRLPAQGAPTTPEDGDVLVDGGREFGAVKVLPVYVGGGAAHWPIEVGEAA